MTQEKKYWTHWKRFNTLSSLTRTFVQLHGGNSLLKCDFGPHKQSSNFECSMGPFYKLRALVLFSWIQVSRILAIFFSFSETFGFLVFFSVLLKCAPSFHLHYPGRWQQVLVKNILVHISIHPSLIIWNVPVWYADKQPHTMMFPPPNFTVGGFLGWYAAYLTLKHVVYYGI